MERKIKSMKKTVLKEYAKLLVKCGLSIKKGDVVMITASLDQPEFVAMVTEAAYRKGAARVIVDWGYQPLTKLSVKYRSLKSLGTVEEFEEARLKYRLEKNPAMLYLLSDDPDGLKGMDQAKNSKAAQMRYPIIKPYRDAMDNKYKWCIAAVPGEAWAKKVFPGMRASAAVEKLWHAILYTSRVLDAEGNLLDSVAEWDKHNKNFAEKCAYLNSLGLVKLHYKSENGTDLHVGLIEDGVFLGGGENTLGGEYYNPNIPTEETFTSPKAGSAEGVVYSSLPLSYRGEVIDKFWLRFEGGRAVEAHAEQGEDLLNQMITMDAGAAMLGECALVPYDSPIRNSGITFYETLFDENAACHLAMGAGFTNCLKDYDKYSLAEAHEKGINDSMIHVDFMIGTADLSIVGETADGKMVQIFENGNWAF